MRSFVLLFAVCVALVVAQGPCTPTICESCIAADPSCVYCSLGVAGFCSDAQTCQISGGTGSNSPGTCTTCTLPNYDPDVCLFDKAIKQKGFFASNVCPVVNTLTVTNGTGQDNRTAQCKAAAVTDGLDCIVAIYSWACSSSCAPCGNPADPAFDQYANKVCTTRCDAINTECAAQIAVGKDCLDVSPFTCSPTNCGEVLADKNKLSALNPSGTGNTGTGSGTGSDTGSDTGSSTSPPVGLCAKYTPAGGNNQQLVAAVVGGTLGIVTNSTYGLLPFFDGTTPAGSTNFLANTAALASLVDGLVAFFGAAMGCTDGSIPPYTGGGMKEVHQAIPIDNQAFTLFNDAILATLIGFGVEPADIAGGKALLETLRPDICNQPDCVPSTSSTSDTGSGSVTTDTATSSSTTATKNTATELDSGVASLIPTFAVLLALLSLIF